MWMLKLRIPKLSLVLKMRCSPFFVFSVAQHGWCITAVYYGIEPPARGSKLNLAFVAAEPAVLDGRHDC